ncbi:MAG: DDE-type integrase/transposase/recombinase [Sterolibacterium sp.]|nr:DDE-type integrase/transposase/recombinase [Sterolibacterium sp.]
MNRLSIKDRARILASLCEGVGINATCRLTGASKNTVLKLLAEVGEACALYQDRVMTGLNLKKVQCDEIWSFVGMKERNVPEELKGILGLGDVYTWTAIDADTKLVPCWHVGTRGVESAYAFIHDLAKRLASRVQLTTDGHKAYLTAIEDAFGADIDYAMLIKLYGNEGATKEDARRYSPAEVTGTEKRPITGNPVMKDVSTSYVERANLTMRMHMRRFTRLTNAFSKKLENHMHAISLYFMFYNFCKIHKTLRVTPAMEAGIADHVWDFEEVLMMAETMPKNFVTDNSSN